jgi:hypothetical protein
MVFAADPPDISMPAPIASYSLSARSASMSVIEPFAMPCSSTKASGWWVMTSTRALPMPTTS